MKHKARLKRISRCIQRVHFISGLFWVGVPIANCVPLILHETEFTRQRFFTSYFIDVYSFYLFLN